MNPNGLTKQQLRASLMEYNVVAPVSARKDVLVGLYANYVMFSKYNCKSATIRVRTERSPKVTSSEFSGDDDTDHVQLATQTEGKTESKKAEHTDSTNNGGKSKTSNGNGQHKQTPSKSPRKVTFEIDKKTPDKRTACDIPKAPPVRKKRCIAMTGPVRRRSPSPCTTAVKHMLPCLHCSDNSVGCDCYGGGGGGIGSWFGYGRCDDCSRPPVTNPLLRCMPPPSRKSPNRFPTTHGSRRRTSWEERQKAPPSFWNPCMLPGPDELDDRIRDRDEKKLCSRQAKKPRSIGLRMSEPTALTQAQIEVMSDAELLETLRQHGFECGPVVPTTRALYQKKLLRLKSNGQVKWSKHPEMEKTYSEEVDLEEDDFYDSDEDDEEMVAAELDTIRTRRGRVAPPERSYRSDDGSPRRRFEADGDRSPRRRFAEDIRHTSSTYSRTPLAQDRFARPIETTPRRAGRRSSREAAEEKLSRKERRVPLYLKFLIFIFVSVIIYAIVYSLEPVFKHPFSQIQ